MSTFRAETPLGHDVQQILLAHGELGLSTAQIRRYLRVQGRHVSEENLRELLRDGRVFVLHADGRYALQATSSTPSVTAPAKEESQSKRHWPLPLLANVPYAQASYIVFDLETTGTDPLVDRIVQIAAIKVVEGVAVAWFNRYVNPGDRGISYALRFLLGMDRDPQIEQRIRDAERVDEVLPRFLAFVAGLPLVAHNARFDGGMLLGALAQEALPVPLIDTMEVALLAAPQLASYRLAELGKHLGLDIDFLAEEGGSFLATTGDGGEYGVEVVISHETLHNALTDVYLTHRVYQRLLEVIACPGELHELLAELLPELYDTDVRFTTLSGERLLPFAQKCHWHPSTNHGTHDSSDPYLPSAPQLLYEVLAARTREPRPSQLAMQVTLVEAMTQERFAMVEAPTGTGKTLAYLTAAVHAVHQDVRRVALSTAYRNLQDQLIAEIDEVQTHSSARFRSQILKGVGNYFCWSKIARYGEEGAPGGDEQTLALDERFVLAYLILRLPHMRDGTVDELSFWVQETFPNARAVVHQLRASAACGLASQSHCAYCPKPAAYQQAEEADILIINHALWLSAKQLPPFDCLVLDEAHTLEDVATNALTKEVSSTTLHDSLTRLWDERTGRGLLARIRKSAQRYGELLKASEGAFASLHRVVNYLPEFGPFVVQFIRRCTSHVDPRYGASLRLEAPPWKIHQIRWQDLDQAHRQLFGLYLKDLLDALARLLAALNATSGVPYRDAHRHELGELLEELAEQRQLAYEIVKVAERKQVYWLEVGPPLDPQDTARDPRPSSWAFKVAPIDVGEALQCFYDRHRSISFVSATLAVGHNDFSFFIDRLGLSERLETRFVRKLPPALDYDKNVFFGMVDYLTYAPLQNTMESFKEELANEFKLFLRFTDGRALGLFTARQRMQEIAARIGPELARAGLPLYVQTPDSSRRRLLDDFRERTESTLFGLRSFWEGVDVRGESLSFVLLEKLPFPLLTEPVHRARAEQLVASQSGS